jgi:hypothetical protein
MGIWLRRLAMLLSSRVISLRASATSGAMLGLCAQPKESMHPATSTAIAKPNRSAE